jgi:hypothetical protein
MRDNMPPRVFLTAPSTVTSEAASHAKLQRAIRYKLEAVRSGALLSSFEVTEDVCKTAPKTKADDVWGDNILHVFDE